MADIEIVVFQNTGCVDKRVASAIVKDDGILLVRLRDGGEFTSLVMPLGDGEPIWGVVERRRDVVGLRGNGRLSLYRSRGKF